MAAERTEEQQFNHNFFEETGIVLRDRTQNSVRGSIGFGYDSGISPAHILSAIRRDESIQYYDVASVSWSRSGYMERLFVSIEHGQAYVYTGDAGEDDPVSIVGDVHLVRSIGKNIAANIQTNEFVKKNENLRDSSLFSWFHGYAPDDSFTPTEIIGDLIKLSSKYPIVSNPRLSSCENALLFDLFANVNNDCFVIAKIDSVNIIGWKTQVEQVAAQMSKTFSQRGRRLFDVNITKA